MDWIIFSVMLFVGMISFLLTGWAITENVNFNLSRSQHVLHRVSFYAFFLGILWGLIYLAWYFVIIFILVAVPFVYRIIHNPLSNFFCISFLSVLDLIAVGFCMILWAVSMRALLY